MNVDRSFCFGICISEGQPISYQDELWRPQGTTDPDHGHVPRPWKGHFFQGLVLEAHAIFFHPAFSEAGWFLYGMVLFAEKLEWGP